MGNGLSEVFSFYIKQLNKLIDLLKEIPVFENVSLYHTLIAMGLISIFIKIIRYGITRIKYNSSNYRVYTSKNDYEDREV